VPGLLDGLDSFVGHLVGRNSFTSLLVGNHIDFQVNEWEDGCVCNLNVKL
jgi:hypothetical protein